MATNHTRQTLEFPFPSVKPRPPFDRTTTRRILPSSAASQTQEHDLNSTGAHRPAPFTVGQEQLVGKPIGEIARRGNPQREPAGNLPAAEAVSEQQPPRPRLRPQQLAQEPRVQRHVSQVQGRYWPRVVVDFVKVLVEVRSEERRVGKECRSRW